MSPKLSILLASYGPQSQRYLDLCFRSLAAQTFQDFELIHVSSGDFVPVSYATRERLVPGTFSHSDDRLHFPAAIAKAYELSDPSSEFILLLNDDTIMHRTCLAAMTDCLEVVPYEMILNPKSNNDSCGMFYVTRAGIPSMPYFKFHHEYEEIVPHVDEIINDSFLNPFTLVTMRFNPFYCTMMKRSTYEKVGRINPEFKTNLDDLDFAKRAQKLGIAGMAALHAFCFHFSGTSSSKYKTPEEEIFNKELFFKLHGERLA